MASREPGERSSAQGVIASLRKLAATAISILQTRLELVVNELEEQRARALQMLLLGAVALFCGAVGVLLVTAWVVVALWEQYRLITLAVLALLYFGVAGIALIKLKARAAERPKLLTQTLAELRRDRDLLGS